MTAWVGLALLLGGCAPNLPGVMREIAHDPASLCTTMMTVHRTLVVGTFTLMTMTVLMTSSRSGLPAGDVACHPDSGMRLRALPFPP